MDLEQPSDIFMTCLKHKCNGSEMSHDHYGPLHEGAEVVTLKPGVA